MPVAVFAGSNIRGTGRIVNLVYNNEGGLDKTKLKGEVDLPGIASGNSYISFGTDETGDNIVITGIAEGVVIASADPNDWHFY
jgi:hypothetical protein